MRSPEKISPPAEGKKGRESDGKQEQMTQKINMDKSGKRGEKDGQFPFIPFFWAMMEFVTEKIHFHTAYIN